MAVQYLLRVLDEPPPAAQRPEVLLQLGTAAELGSVLATRSPSSPGPAELPRSATRMYPRAEDVIAAIRSARGRRSAAAEALGVSRTTLWRLMREFGLE